MPIDKNGKAFFGGEMIRYLLAVLAALTMAACGGGAENNANPPFSTNSLLAPAPQAVDAQTSTATGTSTTTTDQLYQFFAVAFNAAPGVTYMGQLNEAAGVGMTIKQIVNVFTTKTQFTDTYPTTLSNYDFAVKLINNVVGTSATDAAKTSAVNDVVAALALPGWTRGDVIFAIFSNLAAKPANDVDWAGTSLQMKNQVAYAKYYTETLKGDSTDMATLRKVLAGVTNTSSTTTTDIHTKLTVPISHFSYENEQNYAKIEGVQKLPGGDAYAYGDFFNDGSLSLITHTLDYNNGGTYSVEVLKKGHIHFWRKIDGTWVDKTTEAVGTNSTTGCLHPRKAVVADFVAQGEPAIVFACHGYDGVAVPNTGEQLLLVAKDSNGKYKITSFGDIGYYHGVSAGDLDGDGKPDLIVADFLYDHIGVNGNISKIPFAFKNDGDGKFSMINIFGNAQGGVRSGDEIFSIEIINSNASKELFVGGNAIAKSIPINNLNVLDGNLLAETNNLSSINVPPNTVALDILKRDNSYYINFVKSDYTAINVYRFNGTTSNIYSHTGSYPQQWSGNWFPWLVEINGLIDSGDSRYVLNIAP